MAALNSSDTSFDGGYSIHKIAIIIKIQAWFRGYQARHLIGMLRSKQSGSSKYFTQVEAKETVTKRVYKMN